MEEYKVVGWIDHIEDEATGEVIQQGTPMSKRTFGHMDEGIKKATDGLIKLAEKTMQMEQEIKILKDSTLNNMTNNIFLETFNSLDSIKLKTGIYDNRLKKIYL